MNAIDGTCEWVANKEVELVSSSEIQFTEGATEGQSSQVDGAANTGTLGAGTCGSFED